MGLAGRKHLSDLSAQEQKVVDDVERYGCHIIQVEGGDDDNGFSYSIGLHRNFVQPEIVIFGQKPKWRALIINNLVDDFRHGKVYLPNQRYPGVLFDFDCELRVVHKDWYPPYLGWAIWYYFTVLRAPSPFPSLQLVWPDLSGRFPWENGYENPYAQPILDRPMTDAEKEWSRRKIDEATAKTAALPRSDFVEDLHTKVIECIHLGEGAAIASVRHWRDGTWGFLCWADSHDNRDALREVRLHDVIASDPSINEVAGIKRGYRADRLFSGSAWTILENSEDEE